MELMETSDIKFVFKEMVNLLQQKRLKMPFNPLLPNGNISSRSAKILISI